MTTCLLVRHGQSQANVDGVLAGHLDSTLTDEGLAQARRVAEALSGVPVRRIVTSPLSRCRATAEQIAAMPDPVIRNLRITECYSRLAAAMPPA